MQCVNRLVCCSLIVLVAVAMYAQDTASPATAIVPRLVNFSSSAINDQGKPVTGIVGITFSIYNAQQGGSPLWMETQNVQTDAKGNYTVQLGATTTEGLPLSLFTSGEARWLGVRVNGSEEQPRVLLLSVPYALKAADAQTLGGLPASAFVMAEPSGNGTGLSGSATAANQFSSPSIGGSGTQDYIPLWTDNSGDLGNSILFQLGSGASAKIGINETDPLLTLDINGSELVRGLFEMATTGFATPTKAFNSQPLNIESSAYNSNTKKYTLNHFQWQAEPTGNNTANTGATLNLLYGTDPAAPAETGLSISNKGLFTFASGQTFPGTGTISGVTAGTDLTGGGSNGSVTLNVDTTKIPQLATANAFTGNQTVNGNMSATGMVAGSGFQIGSNLFDWGSYANANAFLGFAGNTGATGSYNTASGYAALQSITTGIENTAIGYAALQGNTASGNNTAVGYGVLQSNSGNFNTGIGVQALYSNSTGYQNTSVGVSALYANTTGYYNAATGLDALRYNTTGYSNTANGYSALYSNTTSCCNTAVGAQALANSTASACPYVGSCSNDAFGYQAMYNNTGGYQNEAFGYQAAYSNANGFDNSAFGYAALYSNAGGCTGNPCAPYGINNSAFGTGALYNTNCPSPCSTELLASLNAAFGVGALGANTTGSENTGIGDNALSSNTTGSLLSCVGFNCNAADNLTNATAIGAHALVERSNSLVLGGTGDYAVSVGIGTTKPSNVLTIGRGAGHPVSDSWETYSSRRWKTNIHPLQNALSKVEQLRGVSYDLKDSGKHEIGVIAEEVGQIVPEVVSYEKNGKDAQGVDYSRLTALLIEAVKQQQKQIASQQNEIRKQQRLIKAQAKQVSSLRQLVTTQQNGIAGLSHEVATLESSLRADHEAAAVLASR